jgi:TRAP-type C4-dicarboxylate transport system permease small subunit
MPFEYVYLIMAVCFAMGALIFLYQFVTSVSAALKKRQELPSDNPADQTV